jgi:multisubunit Na+/H+ antiporter MnhB subunit
MTALGDAAKIQRAKNAIIYAIIGLIVTLAAFAITNLVINALEGRH